jgi:uncharacterized protein (UPF0333 family)
MFEREDKKEKIESKNTKENKQMNKKGQGGIEYVILFSFTVVFFIIVIYVANEQLSIVGKQQRLEQAKLALKEIADAATDVYQQGAGARKVIEVTFPEGVNSSGVIVNNTIHINFEGSDLTYQLPFPISGSIPTSSGSYELTFTSYGASISLGVASFSVTPYSLYFYSCSSPLSQEYSDELQITNNLNITNEINLSLSWTNPGVNAYLSDYNLSLNANSVQNITVFVNISPNTIGQFTGQVDLVGMNYSFTVPITVNIVSCGAGTNVSYMVLETYKDAGYSVIWSNYSVSPLVNIATSGWLPYTNITLDLRNTSGSMPGYPKTVQTDSNGAYSEIWNATNMPGSYTVYANYSIYNVNYSFTVEPC